MEPDPELVLTTPAGHINLFASLESTLSSQALQLADKKAREAKEAKEAEKGAPLAPSKADLVPWYADRELKGGKERERDGDSRARDQQRYPRRLYGCYLTHAYLQNESRCI